MGKKATAIWYFMAQTSSSIHEDENISVQYGIYNQWAFPEHALHPYPTLRIKISNRSNKIVFVDLGTSYLKKNDFASVIYTPTITSTMMGQSVGVGVNAGAIAGAIGIGGMAGVALNGVSIGGSKGSSVTTTTYAQRFVSIPPKSSIFLDDIVIFTPGTERAIGDYVHFKKMGIGKDKRLCCFSYKFEDIESGSITDFTEDTTPFRIGAYLNYSFDENFKNSTGIETTYYVRKIVGSTVNTFNREVLGSNKEIKIVDNIFPEWREEIGTGRLELIQLWAMK